MQQTQYNNVLALRKLPKDGEFNRFRRRKWVWMMAVIDAVLAIMVMGRFFHYVSNDARISNTPPESELKDRITLLWTWFAILGAYVCQLLMAIALIISTQMNDTDIALGNCQLYVYGCHALNIYTFVETVIVVYDIFRGTFFQGMAILVTVLVTGKILFRTAMVFAVKLFMKDLGRPSCTCSHNRANANHTAVAVDVDESNLLSRQSWPSR
ncbi:uncharacterized protein LOC110843222 [Folsomia candida]|uniref:Uncharacterized protein n=1 Tax=Folsomia candida TaxID=158441 RepID=A0A226F1C9_FOLCA|nr:uncharacterized protein LOC110843222 [Folsomia candida]OXA63237.1 hypothetical protein Fcan01_02577 [Folsomia candida]